MWKIDPKLDQHAVTTARGLVPPPASTSGWTRARANGQSHPGKVRDQNEDCFLIDREQGLFVVADGLGGHAHGEIASRLAVQAIRQSLELASVEGTPRRGFCFALARGCSDLLASSIRCAHAALRAAARDNRELVGMGSTVVALMLDGATATVAHVGDSRAYRVRGNGLVQLTEDHSLAQLMYANDVIPESYVRTHPWRHVLTQSLGGTEEPMVEVTSVEAIAGDVFLLCSDGLTEMVDEDQILGRVLSEVPLAERCRRLVSDANSMGGRDNITAVLVEVE